MRYLEFTEQVLDRFPKFRKYLLGEYKANEVDLLPSNLEFSLIQYCDGNIDDNNLLESLSFLLQDMKNSSDEDLVMLYNETLTDIENTQNLKKILDNYLFLQKDPHPNLTPEQVKENIRWKKIGFEQGGKLYEESNKKLLEKYQEEVNKVR